MVNREDNRGLNFLSKLIANIKKIIFYPVLILIIVIFFFDQILAIWLAGIFFIVYFVSYTINLSFKRRILRLIQDYSIITDKEIADKLERPLEDIKKKLSSLSKNQRNKKWLVVFLNKRYIFLNEAGVENFKYVYGQGHNEKKIFELLQQKMNIRTRAEVKAIQITLANNDRLHN